jgi:hypothetical protein
VSLAYQISGRVVVKSSDALIAQPPANIRSGKFEGSACHVVAGIIAIVHGRGFGCVEDELYHWS